jgi:hypothetical protein
MEWLRRVIVKGKEEKGLYSRDPSAEKKSKKGYTYTKEQRWYMTQEGIYNQEKAAALLHDDKGVLVEASKKLLPLHELKLDLKKAREALTKENLIPVSAVSERVKEFAKSRGMVITGLTMKNLPLKQFEQLEKWVASGQSTIISDSKDKAYGQWAANEDVPPIEMAVFKECTKDLENQCFDEKGIELRLRFSGLKVVDGVYMFNLNTVNPRAAIRLALKNSLFTVTRGLAFHVKMKDKDGSATKGHVNAVYHGQADDKGREFLFLEPNYGLWRMAKEQVIEAVDFLYNENGRYRFKGHIPRGFAYSIWEKKT